MIMLAVPTVGYSNPKSKKMGTASYLPFARKGKYGKLRTKQARPVKQKQAWIYKQWGR